MSLKTQGFVLCRKSFCLLHFSDELALEIFSRETLVSPCDTQLLKFDIAAMDTALQASDLSGRCGEVARQGGSLHGELADLPPRSEGGLLLHGKERLNFCKTHGCAR